MTRTVLLQFILPILFVLPMASASFSQKSSQEGMIRKEANLTNFTPSQYNENIEKYRELNANSLSHPDFGIVPDQSPCENCIEILDKRTADERFL